MSVATPPVEAPVQQSTAKKPTPAPSNKPVPAINAFEGQEVQTENTGKISVLLDREIPKGMSDTLACRKLGEGEYRISLKCKTDAPLRSIDAQSMVEKVARDVFKLQKISFDINRPINWEEELKHFVAVFRIFA